MKKILFTTLALFSLATFAPSVTAYADGEQPTKEEVVAMGRYTTAPITSEHQDKDVFGYFSFPGTPNTVEEIGVKITNESDEDMNFTIVSNKAITNPNGTAVYDLPDGNGKGNGPTVDEMIEIQKEVTVKAKSSEVVMGKVTLPKEDFEGYKLGGIVVTEAAKEQEKTGESKISQRLAYAFPIAIKGSLSPTNKDLKFDKMEFERVGAGIYSIKTPFTNESTNWYKRGTAEVKIKDSKGKEVVTDKKDITITPESEILYAPYIQEALKAGTYEVTINVTSGDEKWSDTQKVTIKDDQAKDMKETVEITKEKRDPLIYVIIGLLSIIVGYIIFKGIKSSKDKKKSNSEKE